VPADIVLAEAVIDSLPTDGPINGERKDIRKKFDPVSIGCSWKGPFVIKRLALFDLIRDKAVEIRIVDFSQPFREHPIRSSLASGRIIAG
jgi:hypothetical protein